MKLYGLIGFPLSHSASPEIFSEIFRNTGNRNSLYKLFPLTDISNLASLIIQNQGIKGLNVTVPYKTQVIPYLDELDSVAEKIGAVNVIKISEKQGRPWLKGFNSDIYGFEKSFKGFIENIKGQQALILGSGGSSLVVQFVLQSMNIPFQVVSRSENNGKLTYSNLSEAIWESHKIVINTTPVGMFPNNNECLDIQFQFIGKTHYLFDLIYNPEETLFLKNGRERGAKVKNGMEMLHLQAAKAWTIWNDLQ